MKCPFCEGALVAGENRKYETSIEHGFDPNKEDYPERETWVCGCVESQESFWDDWGDIYSGPYVHHHGIITSALGSGSRKCEVEFKITDKLIRITKILYFWKTSNDWYFTARNWAIWCVKHNILFGERL
jgi:hypothetical protein